MCFGGGGGDGGAAADARRREEERQARIKQGTESINQNFSQFNDDFFGDIRQAGLDFFTPTIKQNFGDARERLVFSLANSGLLQSKTAARQFGRLNDLFKQAGQQAEASATDAANRVRQNVETARGNLFNTLNASADANAAASLAAQQADALSQPVTFQPLPNLFANFLQDLSTRAAANPAAVRRIVSGTQLFNNPAGVRTIG